MRGLQAVWLWALQTKPGPEGIGLFFKGAFVGKSLQLRDECPLKEQVCPLVDRLQRLEEECARLQELTHIDELTGFFNYRYLLEALESELERTRRTGIPTGLIMIDLDNFKRLNDDYGHEAGNKALQWSSSLWRSNIRRIDMPCRYGGEEFSIILPGSRLTQAARAAERLRTALVGAPLQLNEEVVNLTASFGVDAYEEKENLSVEEFIKRTDQYLLEAKSKGRNRVCFDESKVRVVSTEVMADERKALIAAADL
jgi:diguanylate cyclase (GGDEF)-like protein